MKDTDGALWHAKAGLLVLLVAFVASVIEFGPDFLTALGLL